MRVYCLGDSITAGYGVLGRECWLRRVGAITGFEMINAGVNGDITADMAARFYRDAGTLRPDLLFLLGGCNDVINEGNDAEARRNVAAILDHAHARGISAMLGIPYPLIPDMAERLWLPGVDYDAANRALEGYAQWLQEEAGKRDLPAANLWDFFTSLGMEQLRLLSLDGVHLNAEGHRLLGAFLASVMAKVSERNSERPTSGRNW